MAKKSIVLGLQFLAAVLLVACSDNSDNSVSVQDESPSSSSVSETFPSSSSEGSSSGISSSGIEDIMSSEDSAGGIEESSSSNGTSSPAAISSGVSSSSSAKSFYSDKFSYGTLVDNRDNQTYRTITIGNQTWMAENLNYEYNGPASSQGTFSFCYDNSADSCAKHGRLYPWSTAMDSAAVFSTAGKDCGFGDRCDGASTTAQVRGVCPEGWHLPSYDEWDVLISTVGGLDSAGSMLKSTSANGKDSFGFGILLAGYREAGHHNDDGLFHNAGTYASFWSSSEHTGNEAFEWSIYDDEDHVKIGYSNKSNASSVRCLKD